MSNTNITPRCRRNKIWRGVAVKHLWSQKVKMEIVKKRWPLNAIGFLLTKNDNTYNRSTNFFSLGGRSKCLFGKTMSLIAQVAACLIQFVCNDKTSIKESNFDNGLRFPRLFDTPLNIGPKRIAPYVNYSVLWCLTEYVNWQNLYLNLHSELLPVRIKIHCNRTCGFNFISAANDLQFIVFRLQEALFASRCFALTRLSQKSYCFVTICLLTIYCCEDVRTQGT